MENLLSRKALEVSQRFDFAFDSIKQTMRERLEKIDRRLMLASNAIDIANPRAIMKRGFSIVKKEMYGIIRSSDALKSEDIVHIMFYEGEAKASIQSITKNKQGEDLP
jgi:exodeoxyribonuclease VII large subunit